MNAEDEFKEEKNNQKNNDPTKGFSLDTDSEGDQGDVMGVNVDIN